MDDLSSNFLELDKRCLTIENKLVFISDEVNSLRASRHEYGNWLNRHNLEIDSVKSRQTDMMNSITILSSKMDKIDDQFTALRLSVTNGFTLIKGEQKHQAWIVGGIVSIAIFFGKMLAEKLFS